MRKLSAVKKAQVRRKGGLEVSSIKRARPGRNGLSGRPCSCKDRVSSLQLCKDRISCPTVVCGQGFLPNRRPRTGFGFLALQLCCADRIPGQAVARTNLSQRRIRTGFFSPGSYKNRISCLTAKKNRVSAPAAKRTGFRPSRYV
jgi:hypothetical protein